MGPGWCLITQNLSELLRSSNFIAAWLSQHVQLGQCKPPSPASLAALSSELQPVHKVAMNSNNMGLGVA